MKHIEQAFNDAPLANGEWIFLIPLLLLSGFDMENPCVLLSILV